MQEDNASWMSKANRVRKEQLASQKARLNAEKEEALQELQGLLEGVEEELRRRLAAEEEDEAALTSFLEERQEHMELIARLRGRVLSLVVMAWQQRILLRKSLVVSRCLRRWSERATITSELKATTPHPIPIRVRVRHQLGAQGHSAAPLPWTRQS